jgi:hypothetical protein
MLYLSSLFQIKFSDKDRKTHSWADMTAEICTPNRRCSKLLELSLCVSVSELSHVKVVSI